MGASILEHVYRALVVSILEWIITIEYDVKSYQVKTAIVKCTKIKLRVLKFKRSHKDMLLYPS